MTRLVMGSFRAEISSTSTTKPSTKFMNAPAAITSIRCQTAASFRGLPNLSGCRAAISPVRGGSGVSRRVSACWLSGLSSPSSAT